MIPDNMIDRVITCDCRDGIDQIPDESVDIIFTDPPYIAKEVMAAYQTLADYSPRVLKPSGYLITYAPHFSLQEIMAALGEKLSYFWICAQINAGGKRCVWARNVMCAFKPILIYQKPPITPSPRVFIDVVSGFRAKRFHPWEQCIHESLALISRMAEPGDLMIDPFAGSGTNLLAAKLLGLRFIGFEIDPKTADVARGRLQQKPITLITFDDVAAIAEGLEVPV